MKYTKQQAERLKRKGMDGYTRYDRLLPDVTIKDGYYIVAKRKIECSNGKTYNSLYEAGKDTGTTSSQIWHVCNGKWKHTKNLTFNYL